MARSRLRFGKRSRSSLAWAAGLFVAIELGSGLLLDYAVPEWKFPIAVRAANQVANEKRQPNVIVLGSSRTGAAIDVKVANPLLAEATSPYRVGNAAVIAGDALSAEFVLDQLLERDVRPEWIVMEVSPETLHAAAPFMREHAARQLNWSHLGEVSTIVQGKGGWMYLESRLNPLYTHRRELIRQAKLPFDTLGVVNPRPVVEAGSAASQKVPVPTGSDVATPEQLNMSRAGAALVLRKWLRDYRVGGLTSQALERILDRCRNENIQVILLGIPTCTAHRAEITPAIETIYMTQINEFCAKHGCLFIDARDWSPDAHFEDALHLRGGYGAAQFTRRFVDKVVLELPKN